MEKLCIASKSALRKMFLKILWGIKYSCELQVKKNILCHIELTLRNIMGVP